MTDRPDDAPYEAPDQQANRSNTMSITGIVCGVAAVLFAPILFGIAGLFLAVLATRRNERLSRVALAVAAGGMILGLVLVYLYRNSVA
ncbi:MAG: hypothetical protein ACR2KL_02755 [Nocardioidaceae bacterium]